MMWMAARLVDVKSSQVRAEAAQLSIPFLVRQMESPWESGMVKEACKNLSSPHDKDFLERRPLAMDMLNKLAHAVSSGWPSVTFLMLRNVTMVWTSFFLMLRSSESVNLDEHEVRVETPRQWAGHTERVAVWIRESKIDQDGKGMSVVSTHPVLIKLIKEYKKARGKAPGSFFCMTGAGASQHSKNRQCYFSTKKVKHNTVITAARLSNNTCNFVLRDLLKSVCNMQAEEAKKYAWHSCRIGGTTEAIAQGVQYRDVKRHGRWTSDATLTYIWESAQCSQDVTANFGRQERTYAHDSAMHKSHFAATQSTSSSSVFQLLEKPKRSVF